MTILGRSIVVSSGYIGGPGYNIVHWSAGLGAGPTDPDGVEEFHDTLEASFSSIAGSLLGNATFTIEPDVLCFNDDTGIAVSATTDPGGTRVITGTGVGNQLSRATCYVMRELTDTFVNGRRLQGRMFIGPISSNAIEADGQISAATCEFNEGYFAGLVSGLGGRLAVWHRPTKLAPSSGVYSDVDSLRFNRTPGTLRSRKT